VKIVITAFEAHSNEGTEAGLAWQWANAYRRLGHDVTVYSQAEEAVDTKEWARSGIDFIQIGSSARTSAPQGILQLIAAKSTYSRWINQVSLRAAEDMSSADLVHHVSWGSVRLLPPFLGINRSSTTRYVWGPLGGGQHAYFRGLQLRAFVPEIFRSISFPISRNQLKRFLKECGDRLTLISTNEETTSYLKKSGAKHVHAMLADGIQTSSIKKSARIRTQHPIRLLWLGRMVATKRPDVAIKVLRELADRGVSARLTMVGDGPMRPRLIQLAHSLRVRESCSFTGRVPWSKTGSIYEMADLLLFHSMRDSSCPTVVEAASYGVPTVGLRIQGLGSMVPLQVAAGPSAIRGVPELIKSLADECVTYLNARESYCEASNEALIFASQQSWDVKVQRILEALEEPC